jgi:hypothetical protein
MTLFYFFMGRMLTAARAILIQLESVGMLLLVLGGGVIALLAHRALEGYYLIGSF